MVVVEVVEKMEVWCWLGHDVVFGDSSCHSEGGSMTDETMCATGQASVIQLELFG